MSETFSLGRWLVYDWNWAVLAFVAWMFVGGITASIRMLTDEIRKLREHRDRD